jgi:hypothetical protein
MIIYRDLVVVWTNGTHITKDASAINLEHLAETTVTGVAATTQSTRMASAHAFAFMSTMRSH